MKLKNLMMMALLAVLLCACGNHGRDYGRCQRRDCVAGVGEPLGRCLFAVRCRGIRII